MAVTQYSVRIVKSMPYRDGNQEWSNRYYFNGGEPGDWSALFAAVKALEQSFLPASVSFVSAQGYGPGSDRALSQAVLTGTGTMGASGLAFTPGDCAAVLRHATTKLSTKNHVVYVFSYYHRALFVAASGDADTLATTQRNAIDAVGADWTNGFTVGGRVFKRTTPDGHLVIGHAVDAYVGHRDFPR